MRLSHHVVRVSLLAACLATALSPAQAADPVYRADIAKLGFTPVFMNSPQVTKLLAQEIEAWKADAQRAQIQLD